MTEAVTETPAEKAKVRRRRGALAWAGLGLAAIVAIVALALTATRYGVLLPQTMLLIEARTDGLKLGRIGRLKITGLSGDVFSDFRIARLTIADEKGVWLEGQKIHVKWSYLALLRRRLAMDDIAAEQVRLIRRPELGPKGKSRGLPLSFDIDRVRTRVVFEEAFSQQAGAYALDGGFKIERVGGRSGKIKALSLTHPGDHLNLAFDFGGDKSLLLDAEAQEARGGALAGALGLPADQPFSLDASASGTTSNGRFTVASRSGERVPVQGQGAWTPDGGQASGRVDLESSRLFRTVARMAGATAAFNISGARRDAEHHQIIARLTSENVTLDAAGPANLAKRAIAPEGLRLNLQVADMTRVTRTPEMGPGRLDGVLTRKGRTWTIKGNAAVERAELMGYRLASASGPFQLDLDGGAFELDAKADGAGGAGSGVLAAALGARPHAEVRLARLKDGAMLFRALDVRAPGIEVSADGGRSLLGGLNFKGRARFTNMAAVRPGASGVVEADWSAVQAEPRRPWTLSVNGKAASFATGMGQLDRLLGPKPTLKAQANFDQGVFSIAEATLGGAAGEARAAGLFGPQGALKMKLDWRAQGPFQAGPVEITGRMTGEGALTGTLAQPKADLTAQIEQLDVPRVPLEKVSLTLSFRRAADGSDGAVALTGTSPYGPARARADFRLPQGGIDLSGLDIDAAGLKAAGDVSLRRGAPSRADLQVAVGPGAFLERGAVTGAVRIVDSSGGAQADLDLQASNASPGGGLLIRTGRLQAQGPLARLPYQLSAEGERGGDPWRLNGQGLLTEVEPGYQLTYAGDGRFRDAEFRTLQPADIRFGGPAQSAKLTLAVGGGQAIVDARRDKQGVVATAKVQEVALRLLSDDLNGRFDADLDLRGEGSNLTGTLDARLAGAGARGAQGSPTLDAVVKARLAGDAITIDADATSAQGLKADLGVVLPAVLSAAPFRIAVARQRPMSGRFDIDGELKPLWDLLVGGERSLSGRLQAQGTIGGTLADPSIRGRAALDGGRFVEGATGLKLQDVVLRADFRGDEVNVSQATAADGSGGSLSGDGAVSLRRDGASSFRMTLKQFRLIDNDLAEATASGQTTVSRGADGRIRVAGDIVVDRAEISAAEPLGPSGVTPMQVTEINRPDVDRSIGFQRTPTRAGAGVTLDVKLSAPRRVFVTGRGLDVELSLDAQVRGSTAKPELTGVARVVRGDYNFADKRFEFDDRGVIYLATSPSLIRLDLTATREDPSLTAVIKIGGTAAKPEITLTSTPVLPNDEVLSQVLFGRSASQLSALEAAQLAAALSSLAGGGGFDVIGNLRSFAGLDRLAFAGGADGGFSVAGGKYLTDDVYLEIIGGGREGPAAQVEWRVRRNLAIISRFAGSGDGRLAVRWRRDF